MNPPPPPPPHGAGAKASGLPPGNYDIFVIPPHSSGSGFLYLPSLQTNRNSFLAGVASTLAVVVVWQIVFPALREWLSTIMASGGTGVVIVMLGVGVAGWAWGKTQSEGNGPGPGGAGMGGTKPGESAGGPAATGTTGNTGPPPKPSWQRTNTNPPGGTTGGGTARSEWEKAREETRKKEEERKKKEQEEKKAKESIWEKAKAREKEAREREEREKRGQASSNGGSPRKTAASAPNSPKKHQQPTARTYLGTDDDEYSYRPYDKPKRPLRTENSHSSIYSESSYAPSQSTSRTTPPPSHRGPYSTKDPDKIVIKAVYCFNNTFLKAPTAQLISGTGSVTDGLILRITTEGLFIDDDVRGVPQREWDVKAWTMKLVEVWCPRSRCVGARSGSSVSKPRTPMSRLFAQENRGSPASSEADIGLLLASLRDQCQNNCCSHANGPNGTSGPSQSGDQRNLHVLRATIRDQEGKRYVFILEEAEGWKVAVGLQRLRRGTQVRALGVSGMSASETRAVLDNLGWT
ncbi:MAG: hypothetical protein M1817_004778 [Caeruleum heppii]|nr:MAG: hypothetical protein M1817_004778 [Caeruleum heppii]